MTPPQTLFTGEIVPRATFQYYDLGTLRVSSVVVVTLLGNPANIRLLDTANFNSYRQSLEHHYIGGLAKQSPVRLKVPSTGHWHLVVDLIGLSGTTRTSVEVLPPGPEIPAPAAAPSGALPPIPAPAPSPLAGIAHSLATIAPESPAVPKAYDVFIAHVAEDREEVVRSLAHTLRERELVVWYEEFELRAGDNLRRKVDAGITSTRFGIVILSPAFLAKPWAQPDLDGLVTRELAGERQILLPIWHQVSHADIAGFSAPLAGRLALSTETTTVAGIASAVADAVRR